jgi:hypothetical protein
LFIVSPTHRNKVDALWLTLMCESTGGSETLVNINNCAELVQCEWTNTPLLDERNTVIGAASIIENTTQRKLNEERQYRAQKWKR